MGSGSVTDKNLKLASRVNGYGSQVLAPHVKVPVEATVAAAVLKTPELAFQITK